MKQISFPFMDLTRNQGIVYFTYICMLYMMGIYIKKESYMQACTEKTREYTQHSGFLHKKER